MMKRFACGAKNVSSFRNNLKKGRLPEKESITYEGLFSTYFFNFGKNNTEKLCDSCYSIAQCKNDMTDEVEKYVALGIVSSEDGKNKREDLNLIVVLDISGSMGSVLDGGRGKYSSSERKSSSSGKTIIEVAKDVLKDVIGVLKDNEGLGIVLFDDRVEIFQPFREVSLIDKEKLLSDIDEITDRGGTNFEIGMKSAVEMITDGIKDEGFAKNKNNRIIFLTDACPNIGGGPNTLLGLTKSASKQGIYTTFIGMGLDFNSKLVEKLTKVRGANYFSVHNQQEFKKILNEDFNYIVTPIAFNAMLFFESEGLEIEKAYGTPFQEESSSCLTKIETLSASAKDERGIKGSIILLKVKDKLTSKLNPSQDIKLTLRYELPSGEQLQNTTTMNFKSRMESLIIQNKIFENEGIRKCVLLCKFARLIRNTIESVNNQMKNKRDDFTKKISNSDSSKLTNEMKDDLKKFKGIFKEEAKILGDKKLLKELDVLDRMIYMK